METQTNETNGQTNTPREPSRRAVETLEALLATAKTDKAKKEILGRVGEGLLRRVGEAQRRLAACVMNGDFEGARQLNSEIDEMNALGWHIVKHPIAVTGLAEKLLHEIVEAFKTGKVEIAQPESPASRHGVSFI